MTTTILPTDIFEQKLQNHPGPLKYFGRQSTHAQETVCTLADRLCSKYQFIGKDFADIVVALIDAGEGATAAAQDALKHFSNTYASGWQVARYIYSHKP